MRGEKLQPFSYSSLSIGSPPHARGKVPKMLTKNPPVRITPACAGKSTTLIGDMGQW